VICLLVGKTVATYALNPLYTHEVIKEVNGTMTTAQEMYTELEIGTATTFYCAIWQVRYLLLNKHPKSSKLTSKSYARLIKI